MLKHDHLIIIKKKFKLSQATLLEVIISAGLIFLIPAYLIETALGFKLNINKFKKQITIRITLFLICMYQSYSTKYENNDNWHPNRNFN